MLIFTGDINLTDNAFDVGYGVGSSIKKGIDPFVNLRKQETDCWIGNFEGVCSDTSEITSYLKDCFRIEEKYMSELSHIDYYGVANNHVMEHGTRAYENMISNLKSKGIGVFGSIQEKAIQIEHNGKNIGVLGFSMRDDNSPFKSMYWNFPEYEDIENEFQNIKACDYKVAYIHWGVEFVDYPCNEQIRMAHWLVDLGFDLIIGMHPHVLQGYEIYKGKYIFYSLGNFVFNMAWKNTKYGAIVKLDEVCGSVSFDYVKIDDSYCPVIVSESEVPCEFRFETLNCKVFNTEDPEKYISQFEKCLSLYRKANYLSMIRNFKKGVLSFKVCLIKDFFVRRFFC
jgi:hypothetical protein